MVARTSFGFAFISMGVLALLGVSSAQGCGGGGSGNPFSAGADSGSDGTRGAGDGGGMFGEGGGPSGDGSGSGVVCPPGLQCSVTCPGGTTTTISGKVYDPALKNPLYNVAVYVPAAALEPLPKGVPTGAEACNCGALFKSGAVVSTTTGVDGSFKLANAPIAAGGGTVPLVLQIGKWRRAIRLKVNQCQDNPQADRSLSLPATVATGDTADNMPDIAVSTGNADTLECLMHRIGLPASEYVAGAGGAGHVHVYAGGDPSGGGIGIAGIPEMPGWSGSGTAPVSAVDLWDSQAHLMPYDITLLSCEEAETYRANPAALESYLDAGGRVFGSHFHYSWFSGPLDTPQAYSAPADWGSHLATWTPGNPNSQTASGVIDQTLNGSNNPFPKGVALDAWLGLNGALVGGQLPILRVKYNAVVGPANTPSQPWIIDAANKDTLFFSFDTPVNAPAAPDGGAPAYCGRAVFSDIHVGSASGDTKAPPGGCASVDLSPQEKAMEFMLFDLSSCVVPDAIPPMGGVPPPPK